MEQRSVSLKLDKKHCHKQVNALQDELGEHKANGRIITIRYRDLISREKTFQGVLLETLLDRLG